MDQPVGHKSLAVVVVVGLGVVNPRRMFSQMKLLVWLHGLLIHRPTGVVARIDTHVLFSLPVGKYRIKCGLHRLLIQTHGGGGPH